jgi:uncharacterized protein (TIGR02231 family)
MTKRLNTLIVISVFWLSAAYAENKISNVVVFSDRAEVTRVSSVSCKDNKVAVDFDNLPVSIDTRTLRAEASGKAKAVGTSHSKVTLEKSFDQRIAKNQEDLEKLRQELRVIEEQISSQSEKSAGLNKYAEYFLQLAQEEARGIRPNIGNWAKVFDMLFKEGGQYADQRQKLLDKKRELTREIDKIQRILSSYAQNNRKDVLNVVVSVVCNGQKKTNVSLSYVIGGATWKPEYDIRFLPSTRAKTGRGKAELTVSAIIKQASGEDWSNVRLVLSSAKPRLGSEAPKLAPITVRGTKRSKERVLVQAVEERSSLQAGQKHGRVGPHAVQLEDKGQAVLLIVPNKVTINSDGRPYWMPVDRVTARARSGLVTIPKLSEYVYHLVKMKNPAPYPLLPGKLNAFRAHSFVGSTMIAFTAPGEEMEISLGIDSEVKVERKDLLKKDRSPGWWSSTKHIDQSYRIILTNQAKSSLEVEVRENIPVSKTEQVEVELDKDKTTRGYKLDDYRGFISWTRRIKSAKSESLDLTYSIHLPEDWKL